MCAISTGSRGALIRFGPVFLYQFTGVLNLCPVGPRVERKSQQAFQFFHFLVGLLFKLQRLIVEVVGEPFEIL